MPSKLNLPKGIEVDIELRFFSLLLSPGTRQLLCLLDQGVNDLDVVRGRIETVWLSI